MQSQTNRKINFDSSSIAQLLFDYPTDLMRAFYEMQSSFLISIYKRYSNIETAIIVLCLARKMHLEILRQRERNLDHDISLNNFWINFNDVNQHTEKIVSIVKSTGIPKETTRRKMAELIKKKILNVNKNKEYSLIILPKNKDEHLKVTSEEIVFLSKFINSFTTYLNISMNQSLIEKEIKTQYSFYWYHFLNCQLKWLKMWQEKIKDIDLILITIQAVIPTLKYVEKNSKTNKVNIEELYKIVGRIDEQYKFSDSSISATSISDITKIPRATCIRKLEKLVQLKFLIRDHKSKKYFVNQLTAARTKNIITKENVNFTINNFSGYLSLALNTLTRFH